jgi:hypothetical protein
MSDTKASPDEEKKEKIVEKVVSKKALYFVPSVSASVEADDVDEAIAKTKKLKNKEEEGDD